MNKNIETGRTLLETLATLGIMLLLATGAIKAYHFIVGRTKAQNTAKMIKTLALERQNTAMSDTTRAAMTVKGPHSTLHVENGTAGNHQPYFWVETTLTDKDFCKALKESSLIQADLVEVDGVADGVCTDHSKISFYFKKNKHRGVYCPDNAADCNQWGDATVCELGYYLDNGKCSACGEHVATCEDEYSPLTCMEGYTLYGSICADLPSCAVDSDCDVCGECTQDGYCSTMCSIPTPDANNDCGENECMVYDNATGTCQYACTRKEYLESTGTQYIDTGYSNINDAENTYDLFFSVVSFLRSFGFYGAAINVQQSNGRTCMLWSNSSGNLQVSSGSTMSSQSQYSGTYTLGTPQRKVIKCNNMTNRYSVDGVGDYSFSGTSVNSNNIHVGMSQAQQLGNVRYYYFKLYANDTLVRDFIPVLDWDRRPAMYDKVSGQLFYNQGTGEFLTD